MEDGLKGKVVLVTGGAGGIGSEICRQFLAVGSRVICHYRHTKTAEKNVLALPADLTVESEVDHLFAQAEKQVGPIDIFVANAGIWEETPTPIHRMSLEQWNKTISTNLTSMFLCFRRFFQGIEKNKLTDPAAVIIGSTAGIYGEAEHADYAASKSAAIYGLMLSLKNEIVRLAPRGRVNSVCPSWTKTGMIDEVDPRILERALQTVPLQKIASTEDVAQAVLFLSSSALAGHITGQSMVLAGGMEGRVLFDRK